MSGHTGKILYVGDYHSKLSNLKDCESLMKYIIKLGKEQKVDKIIFLGDQFDTHAVIRVEIQEFWRKSLVKLSKVCKTYLMVGNHDMKGDKESTSEDMSSMNVFDVDSNKMKNIFIINKPTVIEGGIGAIPYRKDERQFLRECDELMEKGARKVLLAHQTFTGATYDNGFYAEEGIEPSLIPQESIVSGHIHKGQQIGKCWYVGTPKWDGVNDANLDKGLWVVDYNEDNSEKSREFFSTEDYVSAVFKHEISEGDEVPEIRKGSRTYLYFTGTSAWLKKMKKKYKNKAKIKTKSTDRKVLGASKEAVNNFDDFINQFIPMEGVNLDEVRQYLGDLNERIEAAQ